MNITSRSYLTAGVAALGVGAIALTPVQPIPSHVALAPQHVVSNLSVDLAAAINPIQPWVDLVKDAAANTNVLFENWAAGLYVGGTIPAPPNNIANGNLGNRTGGYASGVKFPFLQQVFRNQKSYLAQLPAVGAIIQQMIGNIGNAVKSPFQVGETKKGTFVILPGDYNQNVSGVAFTTLATQPLNPRTVGALLPALADVSALQGILDFATTPISGMLVGAIGPVLGPVLSVVNSTKAILAAIKNGQWATAINETLNIPANAVNALLNGGPVLDLTKIVANLLPPEVTSLGVKMGGLLSPGGVALDAIAATATTSALGPPITINVPGYKVGPIGAFQGLMNYVAKSIEPPQAGASVKPGAAASSNSSPKRLGKASRNSSKASSAGSKRAPRSAAARHAG